MSIIGFFSSSTEELLRRAEACREEENFLGALSHLKKAVYRLQKDKDQSLLEAHVYQIMGELHLLTGSLTPAQECIEKSLILGREGNSQFPIWKSLHLLGDLWLARGQAQLAIETLLNSLESTKNDEEANLAGIFRSLGAAYSLGANYTKAIDCLHQAMLQEKLGHSEECSHTFLRMGYICYLVGKIPQAREYAKGARKLYQHHKKNSLQAMSYLLDGVLYRSREKFDEALNAFGMARKDFKQLSLQRLLLRTDIEIALTHIELDNLAEVKGAVKNIQRKIGGFQAEDINVFWGYLEAWTEFKEGSGQSALDTLSAHLTVAKEMGLKELTWQLTFLQGNIHKEMDNLEEAGRCYISSLEILKEIWAKLTMDLKKDYLKDPRRARVKKEVENFYRTV